jgi:tetratricopeptide (TPR) repeat protein
MGRDIAGFKLSSLRKHTPPAQPVRARDLSPKPTPDSGDGTEQPTSESEELSDPLWVVPPDKPVQTCEELVTNLEELKPGGIQQATLSWNRARQKMMLGDLDAAHVLMCEAVLIHPESLALEGLASLLVTKRAPEKAQRWLDLALEARPDRTKTLEIQGDIYSLQGRIDEAKKALADSLKISVDNQKTLEAVAENVVAEAELQLKGGATAQAELLYRRAIAMSPNNATAAAGMAASHAASGTAEGAQLWAERTLSLDDGNPVALVVQAALATEGGDDDRAIELCKRALKRDPVYAPAHQLLKNLEGQ